MRMRPVRAAARARTADLDPARREAERDLAAAAVKRLKNHTDLPVAVGFGIKTPEDVRAIASVADAAIVGSAVVERIRDSLDAEGQATVATVDGVLSFVGELAAGVRGGRV